MAHGQSTVRSRTIRDDAQLADSKRVGLNPQASYDVEFAARVYDEFLRGAIRANADWTTDVAITSAADLALNTSGNTITTSSTKLDDIKKGQWIRVSGSVSAGNNTWWKVITEGTYSITVAGGTLVGDGGAAIALHGSYIRNGSTQHSYSIQERYEDLTNKWRLMTGARPTGFNLNQADGAIIDGSFSFEGKQREKKTSGSGDGTVTAAAAEDPVSEVEGFAAAWIDNALLTVDIFELNIQAQIGTRPRKGLGNLARTALNLNAPEITGRMSFYFDDNSSAYDGDYEDFTKFSLAFALDLQGGDYYLFELPQCVFTNEPGETPGIDSDIMLALDFASEPGGSYNEDALGGTPVEKTIQICRVRA